MPRSRKRRPLGEQRDVVSEALPGETVGVGDRVCGSLAHDLPAAPPLPAGRLLILDDDPHIGRMIQLIAESVGLQARCMTGTRDFFKAVADWQPTHIAIDLVMPEMDGVEVLQRLADRRCGAKIIITSGVGSRVLDAAGRSGNEHGLQSAGMLSKPFSPKDLRALVVVPPDGAGRRDESSLYRTSRGDAADSDQSNAERLRRALANQELQLVYQPQIHCASGALAGFEALARWVDPYRGTIAPDQFIGCAEAHGLIDALTDQVLELAIGWFSRHFAGSELTLSVNLSSHTVSDGSPPTVGGGARAGDTSLVERVTARCRQAKVEPQNLILELTESSAMENPVLSLDLMTRLRMKGFQLSIDDFGTGYSSMLQLVRLPFSEIKVDKSFVITALRSGESRAVVESIIGLGHSLGLRVVAEGVEDTQTLQYLRDQGCDLAQGYFIARPVGAEAIESWMQLEAHKFIPSAMQRSLL